MTLSKVISDCFSILPEIVLVVALCAVILQDVWGGVRAKAANETTGWLAVWGVCIALVLVLIGFGNDHHTVFSAASTGAAGGVNGPEYSFSRMIVNDKLSDFFKLTFLLGALGVVILSMRSRELVGYRPAEYYTLLLACTASCCLLASSNNMLMLVLALETLSLCSYVLAGYAKHDRRGAEASMKYVLYGSVASAVMLFGITYLYGMTGTLDLSQALLALPSRVSSGMAVFLTFTLIAGGVGFKIAAAPFHFWAPDVYQGAPTPVTAFLAVVSKAAGFAALFRMTLPLFGVSGGVIPDEIMAVRGPLLELIREARLPLLFWILSAASMTLGNVVALWQSDMKRLMAYSSISHAGFLLMGMTAFNNDALEGMLFYLFVYLLMTLGTFMIISLMINRTGDSSIESFRGMFYRSPWLAVALSAFMISLAGLPPFAGFLGKMLVFKSVVGAGLDAAPGGVMGPESWLYYSLAIIGAFNTGIALFYYVKVVRVMTFYRPKDETPFAVDSFDWVTLGVYTVPVVFLFLQFGPVIQLARVFVN